jgi:hypothetical protein
MFTAIVDGVLASAASVNFFSSEGGLWDAFNIGVLADFNASICAVNAVALIVSATWNARLVAVVTVWLSVGKATATTSAFNYVFNWISYNSSSIYSCWFGRSSSRFLCYLVFY